MSGVVRGEDIDGVPEFGRLLRTHRLAARLTQEELAARAGLSPRTVSDLERGRVRAPRPPSLVLLAEALALTGPDRQRFERSGQDGYWRRRLSADQCESGSANRDTAEQPGLQTPGWPADDGRPGTRHPVAGPADGGQVRAAGIVPAQLPGDVSAFVGRRAELATLDALLPGAVPDADATGVVISVVSGSAGVGKTALAIRWCQRIRDRFPDGQLYLNLRGYDPEQPMTTDDALAGFLYSLGLAAGEVPTSVDDRAARYRSLIAGRRILVVLDNASSVEQIRPLLPGTASALVVVTSRDSLAGLVAVHGARRIELDPLPLADAIDLLRQLIGGRVESDATAAAVLAAQCARLPLALRVAAEHAAGRPASTLSELVAELGDLQRRLDLLDAGGDPRAALTAVFSWSYRHLPPDAARLFRLLGLLPTAGTDAYAAAALADTGLERALRTLEVLVRSRLLQPAEAGRWSMHDLLRGYARGLSTADADADRRAAMDRLLDYHLGVAAVAMDLLYPTDVHRRPRVAAPRTPAPAFDDPRAARAWLDTHRADLVALAAFTAANGWPARTVALAQTLLQRLVTSGYHSDTVAVCGYALEAARQVGDQPTESLALNGLGIALAQLGRSEEAVEHLHRALELFDGSGDQDGRARALCNLGAAERLLGRFDAAGEHCREAIALFRATGDRNGQAAGLISLGEAQVQAGQYAPAHHHFGLALGLFESLGSQVGAAWAMTGLGDALTGLGRPEPAIERHRQALELFRAVGDLTGQAWAGNGLGEAVTATGRPGEAVEHHTEALIVADRTGLRDQQARAHRGLGHAHASLGDRTRATLHRQHSEVLYSGPGRPAD